LENLWKKARSISWPHPQKFKRSGLMLICRWSPENILLITLPTGFSLLYCFYIKCVRVGKGRMATSEGSLCRNYLGGQLAEKLHYEIQLLRVKLMPVETKDFSKEVLR